MLNPNPYFVGLQASSLTQFCDPGESLMAYAWATQVGTQRRISPGKMVIQPGNMRIYPLVNQHNYGKSTHF